VSSNRNRTLVITLIKFRKHPYTIKYIMAFFYNEYILLLRNNTGKKFKIELVVLCLLIAMWASLSMLIFASGLNDLIIDQVFVCCSLYCTLVMIHFIIWETFRS
jgi:hypothetical protein